MGAYGILWPCVNLAVCLRQQFWWLECSRSAQSAVYVGHSMFALVQVIVIPAKLGLKDCGQSASFLVLHLLSEGLCAEVAGHVVALCLIQKRLIQCYDASTTHLHSNSSCRFWVRSVSLSSSTAQAISIGSHRSRGICALTDIQPTCWAQR